MVNGENIVGGAFIMFLFGCLIAGFMTTSSCQRKSAAVDCYSQTKDQACWSYLLKDSK